MTEVEAYKSLADFIQDYIYEKEWEHLNDMQITAIEKILYGSNNILFTAGTSMGKTEAAFMPSITKIYQHPVKSVGILYISPLKALINDQFHRIEEMLFGTSLCITKWHGDSLVAKKNKLLVAPNGILQTTPESLEAMLCRHKENVTILFSDLQYIIIDEIHYFMNSQRGLQLLAILERIQRLIRKIPIRIGLSATIKNTEIALDFLNTGSLRGGEVIDHKNERRKYSVSVTSTRVSERDFSEEYITKLFAESFGKRALLFTNSRRDCEILIARIRTMAVEHNYPDVYYVHHGSISKELRENTEDIMKHTDVPILTGTTLTLELGIDIGDLEEVIQAAQPLSISSMVQRVGRSGRKTKHSAISFQLRYTEMSNDRMEFLDLQLVRTIAMIELYFREKYLEESKREHYPYNLVIHEVLSMICEYGCLYPKQLAAEVLELSIFQAISQKELKSILHLLIQKDILQVYDDGAIGLSDTGERLCNQMDFYAVFEAEDTFHVFSSSNEIGSVDVAYKQGDCFFLAGKGWEVVGCDLKKKRIDVIPYKKSANIRFNGSGMLVTDAVTMNKMHDILESGDTYAYLDDEANQILQEIREKAYTFHFNEIMAIEENTDNLLIFPRASTSTINTLYYLFLSARLSCNKVYIRGMLFGLRIYACDQRKLKGRVKEILQQGCCLNSEYILKEEKITGKYGNLLSEELRYKEIVEDTLDVKSAKLFLKSL